METFLTLLPMLVKMAVIVGVLLLLPLPLTWLERKIAAHIQQRPGPTEMRQRIIEQRPDRVSHGWCRRSWCSPRSRSENRLRFSAPRSP